MFQLLGIIVELEHLCVEPSVAVPGLRLLFPQTQSDHVGSLGLLEVHGLCVDVAEQPVKVGPVLSAEAVAFSQVFEPFSVQFGREWRILALSRQVIVELELAFKAALFVRQLVGLVGQYLRIGSLGKEAFCLLKVLMRQRWQTVLPGDLCQLQVVPDYVHHSKQWCYSLYLNF